MTAGGRGVLFCGAVLAVVLACSGCDHSLGPTVDHDGGYLAPTSPENVLHNLQLSYERREIERYAGLLHREFIFRFPDGDEPEELGREFWTHDEDFTGVDELFASSRVTGIELDLVPADAAPATEVDLIGTMKIRLERMRLAVHDVNGTRAAIDMAGSAA